MKIESNMFVYKVSNNPQKKFNKQDSDSSSICPFCGQALQKVGNSNVKVCVNKNCEQSAGYFELT